MNPPLTQDRLARDSHIMPKSGRFHYAILILSLSVYFILTFAYANALPPNSDEGLFSDAAASLATKGRLGSSMMDEAGGNWEGVGRHIYFMPPLHFVLLAGWYKIWMVSLWATRLLSAAFGLVLIAAWLMVFQPIYGRSCVYFAMALALDSSFIVPSARGRMDMACACFGFTAIAVYLKFREKRFTAAVLGATSLIVASGLTHPNGSFYLVGFLVITIWLDRQRWSWRSVGIALVPFALGGVAWGLYIAQDPADFAKQFAGNVQAMGRLKAISSPLQGIYREVTVRYAETFGLDLVRKQPLQAIKGITLVAYLLSVVFWATKHRFAKVPPLGALLLVCGINAALLALVDGQKRTYYMIHIVPPLNAAVVAWALWVVANRRRRVAVALVLASCACVQIALHISRIQADRYHREYLPVVAFVRAHLAKNTKLVYAPPEYGFALGFGPLVRYDSTFGFYTGKQADMIVSSQFVNGDLTEIKGGAPPIVQHIESVIKGDYDLAYNKSWAQVFLAKTQPLEDE
jgi:hypothetical protein